MHLPPLALDHGLFPLRGFEILLRLVILPVAVLFGHAGPTNAAGSTLQPCVECHDNPDRLPGPALIPPTHRCTTCQGHLHAWCGEGEDSSGSGKVCRNCRSPSTASVNPAPSPAPQPPPPTTKRKRRTTAGATSKRRRTTTKAATPKATTTTIVDEKVQPPPVFGGNAEELPAVPTAPDLLPKPPHPKYHR